MADHPLAGLNIVVTRPREQAAQLAQRIGQAGGNAILFPLLEISPVSDPSPLRKLVARLHEFDLAIFISPNAVRYGMEAIRAAGVSLTSRDTLLAKPADCGSGCEAAIPAPDASQRRVMAATPTLSRKEREQTNRCASSTLKIATVGQGSAKALRDLGVQEIIAPQDRFDSEALLALPELQNVKGWRVVIFRGDGGRELLGDTLKARGAKVEYAECYRRAKPQQDAGALLAADPHAITVSSSEALGYLWDMLDEPGRMRLANVPLFVPHARIAEAAQRLGWRNVIPTAGGDDGLLSGLVAWANSK
ncbi:MAG: uroporphyrinogen-III synthase [Nitrosomonadales bacterium]|nr:uroporphyrinogen-III synthase [Nitrosomonadales bacterium]